MYLLGPFSILDLIKYTFVYLFFLFCKFLPILVNFASIYKLFPSIFLMSAKFFPKLMLQTVTFEVSYWVKFWKWTAYHKIIKNFENEGRIFTHSPNYLHANFFQNNAKCTYFHPKMYLRGQKMYLVNNVLENQIWAVPLLNDT